MDKDTQTAYEWAKKQDFPSVAARYAKMLASEIDRLTADLAARDKEIAQMQEAQRWIPVTERPPEASDGEWVAFTLPSYFLPGASSCRTSRYFSDSGWCNKEIERATHWMPLPPKGE